MLRSKTLPEILPPALAPALGPAPRLVLAILLTLACALGLAATARAELSEFWQAMNQPVEPFRIAGNLYYVGASSVTSFLITTPEGHILIDGGFEETVPLIRSGVEKLGFRYEDIRILLNSHAHLDHAGGLATIKRETGAQLLASALDAPVLARGGRADDLFGDDLPFAPVTADRQFDHGEQVELGGTRLKAHITAGHTRGCTSWEIEVEDGGESLRAVSICSLSALDGMVFEGTPTYPGIADDFRRSFATLEAISADIFLASHAEFFRLEEKREALQQRAEGSEAAHPFIDPDGYRDYISRARARFEKALATERDSAKIEETPKDQVNDHQQRR